MRQYVEAKQFQNAYQVACLGVTEADWRLLGIEALQGDAWDVARECFVRLQDVCYLDLIHQITLGHQPASPKPCVTGLVLAYQVLCLPALLRLCYFAYDGVYYYFCAVKTILVL